MLGLLLMLGLARWARSLRSQGEVGTELGLKLKLGLGADAGLKLKWRGT